MTGSISAAAQAATFTALEMAVVRQYRLNFAQLVGQGCNHVQHWLKLLLVVGCLCYVGSHHQQTSCSHHRLCVITLLEAAARHGHDT